MPLEPHSPSSTQAGLPVTAAADDAASVLVGGTHPVGRAGLCHILCAQLGCRIVGEAKDAAYLLTLARRHAPDLTVVELPAGAVAGPAEASDDAWLKTVPQLRQELPQGRILMVCAHPNPAIRARCLHAGAHGFLPLTETAATDLRVAAEAVLAGGEWFQDDGMAGETILAANRASQQSAALLTRRERQVLVHVADGRTSRQIAVLLGISPRTVEAHRESVARKLGVSSVAGLTRYVMQHGLNDD
jgi:DNA-binding NarL/FixJ family response regulator